MASLLDSMKRGAIAGTVKLFKDKVVDYKRRYIEQFELTLCNAGDANAPLAQETGEQGRLNRVIAALEFDETKMQRECNIICDAEITLRSLRLLKCVGWYCQIGRKNNPPEWGCSYRIIRYSLA